MKRKINLKKKKKGKALTGVLSGLSLGWFKLITKIAHHNV